MTDKLASATDANGDTTHYTYDPLDRLATVTDAMARTTRYAYDAVSRPNQVLNTAIQATPLVQQSFTPDGLVASVIDANSNAATLTYDRYNRLVTTAYPGGSTETYTYDADSNVLTRKTRADGTIAFAWDTLNRLTTKTPPSGPAVNYTYDLAGRLRSASDNSAAIPSAVSPTGNPVAYTTSFTYDALNRPTGVSWNPAPTATAPGAVTPTYDANGNLTFDGTHTYGYDAENRLVSASGAGTSAAYTFDAQGRRKTVTTGGTTTVFVTDADDREVLEYDGASGAIQRWYAYGLGPNDVLGQMNVPANTRTTPVPDLLGSVVAAMASSTGTLSRFAYRPYGASASPATPFGFTGQRLDVEAGGLYYFSARAYSPRLGRFLQTDPIGYDGGINLYAYVDNDPLNLIDPYGLKVLDGVQAALFGLSFCPSVCGSAFSLIDAGVSGFRGDYWGAGISATAAIAGIVSDAGVVKVAALGGIAAADALKTARVTKPIGELRASGLKDAHHVVQDAAVKNIPGYNSKLAPGVHIPGPSTAIGSPHYIATQIQRQSGGGTLAAEMRIGYKGLRRAGYSEAEARQIITETDVYFRSIGATPSTSTRILGNRN